MATNDSRVGYVGTDFLRAVEKKGMQGGIDPGPVDGHLSLGVASGETGLFPCAKKGMAHEQTRVGCGRR